MAGWSFREHRRAFFRCHPSPVTCRTNSRRLRKFLAGGRGLRFNADGTLLVSAHACIGQNCALGLPRAGSHDFRCADSNPATLLQWLERLHVKPAQGSGMGSHLAAVLAGFFRSGPLGLCEFQPEDG